MTIEQGIELEGGLEGLCKLFGWQGGTIHQAKAEMKRRLSMGGIFEDKNGELVMLKINQKAV